MKLFNVASVLLALLSGALSGCGGGGGGGGAATINPAVTGGTITSISINSPPVVSFVVKDSSGNPISGLKLFDLAGAAGDPACGGSNVTFAIAKFDGYNWQSLISRQRYAADDLSNPAAPKHSVIEGTTDPKPTSTLSNPGTAVADPSTRVVGILEEANGVYTYRFATDVTTPLPMANAITGRNVAVGKVANNGQLAVKDGATIHRVALQLCYVDPVTRATVKANPYLDFTLGADGRGAPVMDSQGNLLSAHSVVDRASCNDCHQNFAQHGGNRVEPQYCVMCHNPGSSDFETGNPIDFKLMVHKFHMGKRLTQDYAVRSAIARKTDAGTGAVSGVLYPQDQRNCVKCHDGSAGASHKTAQGDNWLNKASKNACWSCHDDYKTAGSGWQIAHTPYAAMFPAGVANPDATSDLICQQCHNNAGTGVAKTTAKAHEITEWALGENYQYNIWNVVKNADNTVTVEYSVSNPKSGMDYDILNVQYQYAVVNTAGTTTTKTFRFGNMNMLFGWGANDYANDGAIGRPWNSSCTVAPTASPTCDAVSGLPKAATAGAITRGQPVSINALFDSSVQRVGATNRFRLTSTTLPAAASGTIAVAFQGRINEMKNANSSWSIPVKNVVKYFAMNGDPVDRRQVVSAEKCNACHGRNLAYANITTYLPGTAPHGGSRTEPEVCVICHNGNNPLNGTTVAGGVVTKYAESADFKRMIHMMHAEQEENFPIWPKSIKTTGMNTSLYSGLKNCESCHVNGSYKQNRSIVGTSTTYDVNLAVDSSNASITDTDASNNLVITPRASACSSCHTSDAAKSHMVATGGASFGNVTQAGLASGTLLLESCDGCHMQGGMSPVDLRHDIAAK